MKLAYCPVGNGTSINPFHLIFDEKVDASKSLEGVDAVVFWGGTDIHPSLYGQQRHLNSQAGPNPSHRDLFEWKLMKWCKLHDIPMIGVCRGAQMLCAFAGGQLIQHVNHHGAHHMMRTSDGEDLHTTSCHHQMMYPWDVPHELLAWSVFNRSSIHEDEKGHQMDMTGKEEPEVVYFPEIKGLAIQGHPEWVAPQTPFAQYCNRLVAEKLLGVTHE